MKFRVLSIGCLVACLSACATGPLRYWGRIPPPNLVYLIVEEEAVGLVRVERSRTLLDDAEHGYGSSGGQLYDLRTVDTYRGVLADRFVCIVGSPRITRANAQDKTMNVGEELLVFTRSLKPKWRQPQRLSSYSVRFKRVKNLIVPGDEVLGDVALAAIKESVKYHDKPGQGPDSFHNVKLGEEAAHPFLNLLKHEDARVRKWSLREAISYLKVSEPQGRKITKLLEDPDEGVREQAAMVLASRRFTPARKKLFYYHQSLDPDRDRIREITREALVCMAVKVILDSSDHRQLTSEDSIHLSVNVASEEMTVENTRFSKEDSPFFKSPPASLRPALAPAGSYRTQISKWRGTLRLATRDVD